MSYLYLLRGDDVIDPLEAGQFQYDCSQTGKEGWYYMINRSTALWY